MAGGLELQAEAVDAITDGLEVEYPAAIRRAQSLLVAIDELRLPGFLVDDPRLRDADRSEVTAEIEDWAGRAQALLRRLRTETDTCAYLGDGVGERSRFDYCARVARAEHSLRANLYAALADED